MIAKALQLAAQAHDGQKDKGGEDYILHPIEVMLLAKQFVPLGADNFRRDVMVVAILHDAVEDAKSPLKHVISGQIMSEFGPTIYDAVMAMTHRPHGVESYQDYIERVAQNPIARIVKIADLTHNMDTGRLPDRTIGEKDYERWDKYRRALVRLKRED